jgi:hypothetical protein
MLGVLKGMTAEKLAGCVHIHAFLSSFPVVDSLPTLMHSQYHDTYGAAVPNLLISISLGLRTLDSSIARLGGCPLPWRDWQCGDGGRAACSDSIESRYVVEGRGKAWIFACW